MSDPTPGEGRARVARFERPGKQWYIAVCEPCGWSDRLSWKYKEWAKQSADHHNKTTHSDEPTATT